VAAVILQAMPEVDWFKLVAFVWFAGVGSVTPGPNNAIALSTAANFGARAVVPHSIGVAVGFSTMLVGAGLGTYGLLLESPALAQALKLFGVLYLCWLGVQLARSGTMSERAVARAPRWFESAVFQYANPKAWMLAAGTVGAYQGLAQPAWLEQALIVAIFMVCCVISNFIWAWLGTAMRAWLEVGSRLRVFNLAVGASLVLTAVWLWRGSA